MLDQKEIGPFLQFLFSDVAVSAESLEPVETAAAVRYLQLLACNAVPKSVIRRGKNAIKDYKNARRTEEERKDRTGTAGLAATAWRELLGCGEFPTASNQEASAFLERHSQTYFRNHPGLAGARKLIQEFDLPGDVDPPFGPPDLVSASTQSQRGDSTPRFKNDLSERIYTADHALKRSGVKTTRVRIAESLNDAQVSAPIRRRKEEGDERWSSQDVNERVKEYERLVRKYLAKRRDCFLREHGDSRKKLAWSSEQAIDEVRTSLASKWVGIFRASAENEWMCREINRELQAANQERYDRLQRLHEEFRAKKAAGVNSNESKT